MGIPLRLLNVEDNENDAMLLHRHLTRAGYDVTMERVDTPEATQRALSHQRWDVVIADYVLPRCSAPAALALVRAMVPDLPFILVSGAVGEEAVAVAALRAGARDYMLKSSLAQFAHAIALTAGVIPEERRAEAHLELGKQYLIEPDVNLAKATYHGEEALAHSQPVEAVYAQALFHLGRCYMACEQYAEAVTVLRRFEAMWGTLEPREAVLEGEVQYLLGTALEKLGQYADADQAMARAEQWFNRLGLDGRAEEVRQIRGTVGEQDLSGSGGRWLGHLERGRYQLLTGDLAEAVREAILALHLSGTDSSRCFECYMLLQACARKQGHFKDALNFGLSARMMAVEAERHDLGYVAAEALVELAREVGPGAKEILRQVEQDFRRWELDVWKYLPPSLQ